MTRNPPRDVSDALICAVYTPEIHHTADHKKLLELSDTYLKELFAADILVLGAPTAEEKIRAAAF